MRQSIAAIAVIGMLVEDRVVWLARWNAGWEKYHFVGGHKRPEETFRECLTRELAEELGLREGEDYRAESTPVARLEFNAISEGSREQTCYNMELFDVELSAEAVARVSADTENRWLDAVEIRNGRTRDDAPISVSMWRLLVAWGCVSGLGA